MNRRFLPGLVILLCWPVLMTSALPVPQSTPMEECTKKTAFLKVGMTRADVKKIMSHDGGPNGIYKEERFLLVDNSQPVPFPVPFIDANQKFPVACKITFDFRPQGIPDKDYNDPGFFQRWMSDHAISVWGSPSDAIVKISAPFLQAPFVD